MNNKQIQKAGDSSQLFQGGTVIVNYGIEEKRAREICTEMLAVARRDFTDEAIKVAEKRVKLLEDNLIPKMAKFDGAMNFFANPEFQLLLTEAQRTAMASDRDDNMDLLSDLLLHRIQKGENKEIKTGIKKAIQIINDISDDALIALTIASPIQSIKPLDGSILAGLDTVNRMFQKLCYAQFPTDFGWMDHLDILDCIRISSINKFKKLEDVYFDALNGYTKIGIKKDSDSYIKATETLKASNLDKDCLIDHELLDGYVRLPLVYEKDLKKLNHIITFNGQLYELEINEIQQQAFHDVWSMYETSPQLQKKLKDNFVKELYSRTHIKTVADWWNKIPNAFTVTSVGKVIAFTNANRCGSQMPSLY